MHPTVFKKDLDEAGFGANVLKYVKLNKEDREIATARQHFCGSLFRWLEKGESGLVQSVEFSMEDDFTADQPRTVMTVNISRDGDKLIAACTNLGGIAMCTVVLAAGDTVARLRALLCDELKISAVTCWDGADAVPETSK